jgi:hypothetical protein
LSEEIFDMWNTSLWDYKLGEFRQFINTINPKSTLIPDAFEDCRELPCFPQKFRSMTVQEVSADPKLIEELYYSREGMQAQAKYNLGCKPKVREKELINSLDEICEIDTERAKAKVVLGRHSDSQQTYCYALEVAIAPRTDVGTECIGEVEIIDSINDLTSSDGGGTYFDGGNYYWTGEKGKQKGLGLNATSIRSILSICGFNRGEHSSRIKKPCVLFINLKCRVIDWLGAKGKTQINTKPFARDIVETVSKLAYQMPSYYGHGLRWTESDEDEDNNGVYIEYLRDFLRKRRHDIELDPSLRVRDRLTQSGVWYRIRPIMIEDGFKPRNKSTDRNGRVIYDWGTTRKGLTSKIAETIRELWPDEEHVTREYLGIVAKARAMMYFNGQVFPIDFESKEELAMVGTTDLVVVEKDGITDVLLEAAKRYRIALVATGGETSKYAQDLIRLADEAGLNVCVLTDYDINGIGIWRHAGNNIARIGIDRSIIKWLRDHGYRKKDGTEITEEDVEEEYSPNPKLLQEDDDPYLLSKRIELDSIVEKAGAHALWHYIVYKLEETFPEVRDYSPVISEPEPETFYTQEINDFIEYINNYTRGSLDEEWTRIKQDAEEVNGLTEVDLEEEANDIILKSVVQEDEGIKSISAKLKELMDSGTLPKAKQLEPEHDRKRRPKPVKAVEVSSGETRLKEGVKIHVDPEYDIFGVFSNNNKSTQNQHDSRDKIDEKLEGGSKSIEETDSLESSNDTSFDMDAIKNIEARLFEKYPTTTIEERHTIMNNLTMVVKSYRLFRALHASLPKDAPARSRTDKALRKSRSAFNGCQKLLKSVGIVIDENGIINGKWIWGKLE